MDHFQSNDARFIYTVSKERPQSVACKLKSGLYLSKSCKSNEKIKFTETDMYSLIYTVMFFQVFQVSTSDSYAMIIKSGQITYSDQQVLEGRCAMQLSILDVTTLLDDTFGQHFSCLTKRAIFKWNIEYNTSLRMYPFNVSKIQMPSASDIIKLHRFVNMGSIEYTSIVNFITSSNTKWPLQGAVKQLW